MSRPETGTAEAPLSRPCSVPGSGGRDAPGSAALPRRGLRALYERMPAPLRWIAMPMVFAVRLPHLLLRLLRRHSVELWRVEGKERNSGLPLSLLCAASGSTKNYLLDLVFAASFRERRLGRAWLWNLARAVRRHGEGCSLVFADVRDSDREVLGSRGTFYIPGWLLAEVDLPLSPEVLAYEGVKSDLRRIRKHALQFEVTRDPARFDDFYFRMHLPFIQASHGSSAYLIPHAEFSRQLPHCELIAIRKGEDWIGGTVIDYGKECPRLWLAGVTGGNPEFLGYGVIGATYVFSLQHLQAQGHSRASVGMSRAFLRDGVLRYKRKWSPRIVGTWPGGFALKVLSRTPAAHAFLKGNPFVFESEEGLAAAVFVDATAPLPTGECARIERDHSCRGLSRIILFRLGGGQAAETEGARQADTIPAEFAGRMEIRSLGSGQAPLPITPQGPTPAEGA